MPEDESWYQGVNPLEQEDTHPAFRGQREFTAECFGGLDFADEDTGTSDSEVEETMVERRMRMTRAHARIKVDMAKELNVAPHPAYTGYRTMPPVFQRASTLYHPAMFGFRTDETLPPASVVEVKHHWGITTHP